MFDTLGSDIVVMQELKIQCKDLRDDMVLLDGWDCYFSLPKHKKGYSGVGIYTRNAVCAPIRAEEGILGVLPSPSGVPYRELGEDASIGGYPSSFQIAELGVDPAALDAEGRCVVLEFPAFVLFGVYSPANSNGLRDDFRYGFLCALDCRIRNLCRSGKNVVLTGDLNVSRNELDTASAFDDMKKAGITRQEYLSTPNRRVFNQLLVDGEFFGERDEGRESGIMVDTTRAFHPDRKGMYTHWEQKINARPGNFGSRIDYVLVSEAMHSWLENANIQEGLLGSDHCPVYVDFKDTVTLGSGETVKLVDVLNPPNTFRNGLREKDWSIKNIPTFSGKLLAEFDRRRSIKNMFAKPSLERASSSALEKAAKNNIRDPEVSEESSSALPLALQQQHATQALEASDNTAAVQPSPKRKSSDAQTPRATKRSRGETSTGTKQTLAKGQKSLQAYLKPASRATLSDASAGSVSESPAKSPVCKSDDEISGGNHVTHTASYPTMPTTPGAAYTETRASAINGDETTADEGLAASPHSDGATASRESTEEDQEPDPLARLASAEQQQKSWGQLFSKPVSPMCEGHAEPCKTMLTKKKGSNQGRSFWMCARPLGPSGSKESGTQWRCPTFIWCSDWSTRRG